MSLQNIKRKAWQDPIQPAPFSRFRQVPPTIREQQLQMQVDALRQQLLQAQQQCCHPPVVAESKDADADANARQQTESSPGPAYASESEFEEALLEILTDPLASASTLSAHLKLENLAHSDSVHDKRHLARSCWEHLLEIADLEQQANSSSDVDESESNIFTHLLAKMSVLHENGLHCPQKLWKEQCDVEAIEIRLAELFGCQRLVGRFLAQVFRALMPDVRRAYVPGTKESERFYRTLDGADLLLVIHTLAEQGVMFSMTLRQRHVIEAVHLARHGPASGLVMILKQASDKDQRPLADETHNGFPLLFQPLFGFKKDWLNRTQVLLEAGANGGAVYNKWNCSALHMLCYRKSANVCNPSEDDLVQAARLLLKHGAKLASVLNLVDHTSQSARDQHGVHGRTALIQAASAGNMQMCRVLLEAGADASVIDSTGQSMLDYLFYLKHAYLRSRQRGVPGANSYSCMDLYALVNNFQQLRELLTDELKQDCRSCGRCRFLLASAAASDALSESDEAQDCEDEEQSS